MTWELILMLDRHDPVRSQTCPDLLEPERLRMLATLLGRYTVNIMHSYGAWQGLMLTGSRAGRLL